MIKAMTIMDTFLSTRWKKQFQFTFVGFFCKLCYNIHSLLTISAVIFWQYNMRQAISQKPVNKAVDQNSLRTFLRWRLKVKKNIWQKHLRFQIVDFWSVLFLPSRNCYTHHLLFVLSQQKDGIADLKFDSVPVSVKVICFCSQSPFYCCSICFSSVVWQLAESLKQTCIFFWVKFFMTERLTLILVIISINVDKFVRVLGQKTVIFAGASV